MWYLVLYIIGNNYAPYGAMSIIPEKYPTEQSCKDAASTWRLSDQQNGRETYKCIKAPTPEYVDAMPLMSYPKSLICTADGKNCKANY